MKRIIVKWTKSDSEWDKVYGGKRMLVIESTHPRFLKGKRFDYGFLEIATVQDGYTVEIQPL